jgi:hypothetical protein
VLPIGRKLCRITQNGRAEWKSEQAEQMHGRIGAGFSQKEHIKRTDFKNNFLAFTFLQNAFKNGAFHFRAF